MNIFHKVTLQSLKKNKTRTIVTIIGIILSASMICAVTTFTSSMFHHALALTTYREGSWQAREEGTSFETYEKVAESEKVETAAYFQQLGYAELPERNNPDKPYLYVLGDGKNGEMLLPIHITSGHYPQSRDEILLPEHLQTNGGLFFKLGDTISLGLGERMSEEFTLGQHNPYTDESEEKKEYIALRETRNYRVVGFYERLSYEIEDYSSPGYTAITLADEKPDPDALYDVYYCMKDPGEIYDFQMEMNLVGGTNDSMLHLMGTFRNDHFSNMLTGLAVIVIALIMFGSVSLIYNAFSISVSERTKQFGLLSSIGATKKQLAGMIRFEALVVSAIGIPLGILAGVGGIGVTLMLLGDKLVSLGSEVTMKLHVSPLSILLAAVIALVTVLISAWIPSRRARKVSAVEAIRQTEDIKTKPKEVKTSKLTYRIFGLPGVLASKYYKRSKKKYRATVFSLFMSVVLFISASSFGDYLVEGMSDGYYSTEFDLSFFGTVENLKQTDHMKLLAQMRAADQVTAAACTQTTIADLNIPAEKLTDRAKETLKYTNWEEGQPLYYNLLFFVDDDSFRELLKMNGLSEEEYMDRENPKALAVSEVLYYNPVEQRHEKLNFLKSGDMQITATVNRCFEGYYRNHMECDDNDNCTVYYYSLDENGEMLGIPEAQSRQQVTLNVGAVIRNLPYYISLSQNLQLLYPMSAAKNVIPEYEPLGEARDYMMQSSNHAVSYQAVKDLLEENKIPSAHLVDLAETDESSRNLVTIVRVFSYGFIVLISLIAAANVFNTISTNVALRRREFAMLRSVGMQQRDFNKMMNFECLLYGTKSLLFGLPVAVLITYQIWRTMAEGFRMNFRLPLTAMGIAVLSVFLVVFATMMYAMRKIKKDDLIDALKNENA